MHGETQKISMIENKMWVDPRNGLGKLVNPGKSYFLGLHPITLNSVGAKIVWVQK